MIHEYAEMKFGGNMGVERVLEIPVIQQRKLKQAANNLSPLEGGRHSKVQRGVPWSLELQRDFTADLLRRWIEAG
jgi:hypothetical protein